MTATALAHPDMGAHGCLARAVAASDAREYARGYLPQQHALGRALDLDCRFYTPQKKAFPTVQAELVQPEGPNVHILGSRPSKTPPKFHEKTHREREKKTREEEKKRAKMGAGAGKTKREISGLPPFGPPPFGPPTLCLPPPPTFCVFGPPTPLGPHASGPHALGPPPVGPPTLWGPLLFVCLGPHPSGPPLVWLSSCGCLFK